MVGYADCPYCEKETEVEFEGFSEGEEFEVECDGCEKEFVCSYQTDISFDTFKKPKNYDKHDTSPEQDALHKLPPTSITSPSDNDEIKKEIDKDYDN